MVMVYITFVELETLMLHAKFQDPRNFGSGEDCDHLGHVTWICHDILMFCRSTVIYPVSNLIQFRIKWSYRHELHSSCSIKKQIFCMVMKSIFFSSSARSQILKTYLHAKK